MDFRTDFYTLLNNNEISKDVIHSLSIDLDGLVGFVDGNCNNHALKDILLTGASLQKKLI